jgi:putative PIN family toxin of toxin-antitoxin system
VPRVKAVLDTNVIVSALLADGGREALILDLAFSARYTLVVSDALLEEYEEVLRRPRFRLDPRRIKAAMREIRSASLHVDPQTKVRAARDPDDNKVLECALAAEADYVVTGNTRHFPSQFQGIRIIPPRRFMVLLAAQVE